MFNSLRQLYRGPYNRQYPFFALQRYLLWKTIRLFRLKNVTYSIWSNKKINLNYNSLQSAWLMYNYWVDWEEFNLIKDVLRPSDIVFDIGANMGFYTIWMSKFINSSGKIHSFEPDSKSYVRLLKNIELNNIQDFVNANRMAVSNNIGMVKFSEGLDGENHIINKTENNYEIISCTTIDQYVFDNQIKKIKYIKIDIEGFEYQALSGAIQTLTNGVVDIFQIEINSQIHNSATPVNDLLKFIEGTQYKLCSYNIPDKKFEPIDYSISRDNYFMVKTLVL
jgi:FkbM family methyltransferase